MFPSLALLFLLSGASALIYQILWLRQLGLVFGVTVHAASTVWAAFMGGLALGSAAAGLIGDRVRRPLLWFGAAELLTGVTALMTPWVIAAAQPVYVGLAAMGANSTSSLALRFAIAFTILIVPTALMGATMPLLLRSSAFGRSTLGSRAGALYASNTAGAIAGTLAAGLFLIPTYGIRMSFLVACAVNVLVGFAAIVIASTAGGRRITVDHGTSADRAATAGSAASGVEPSNLRCRVVLVVFATSGFVSLALEVVWFRVITLFLRPTVYGYAFMLATLLFGIALGSSLATPLMRRSFPRLLALAVLEGALAMMTLASFMALALIPASVASLEPVLSPLLGPYLTYQAVVSVIVILPAALAMGVAFPIGLSVWLGEASGLAPQVSRRTGVFYSLNLAGAIAGSVAAGFFLLPRLGSRGSLVVLAALTLACALALLWASRAPAAVRIATAAALTAGCAAIAPSVPDPFAEYLRQRYPGERVIWRREAIQATVSVHEQPDRTVTLNVNGNHQASSAPAMAFVHRRIGNLAAALHPDPRRALVIGLGGGATAGAVSRYAGVSVDVVELSPEVITAAGRFFRSVNASVLQQPDVHVRVDDGRNYLLMTNRKYDVITADVILPIHAGAGNLYSVEYFGLVRRALNPGGIAVQWVAGTESEYKLIMRTFLSVFPETTLWADGSLMVGSLEPLRLRRRDLQRKLDVISRRDVLGELGITSFDKLTSLYRAGPAELRAYVGEGPILTDDRPLVEYFLSLPRDRAVDLSGVRGDVTKYVENGSLPN